MNDAVRTYAELFKLARLSDKVKKVVDTYKKVKKTVTGMKPYRPPKEDRWNEMPWAGDENI